MSENEWQIKKSLPDEGRLLGEREGGRLGGVKNLGAGDYGLLDTIALAVLFDSSLKFDSLALGRGKGRITFVNHGVSARILKANNPELAEIRIVGIGELDGDGQFDAVAHFADMRAGRDPLGETRSPKRTDFVTAGD